MAAEFPVAFVLLCIRRPSAERLKGELICSTQKFQVSERAVFT